MKFPGYYGAVRCSFRMCPDEAQGDNFNTGSDITLGEGGEAALRGYPLIDLTRLSRMNDLRQKHVSCGKPIQRF